MPAALPDTLRDGPFVDLSEDYYLTRVGALVRFVEPARADFPNASERTRRDGSWSRAEPVRHPYVRSPERCGCVFHPRNLRHVGIAELSAPDVAFVRIEIPGIASPANLSHRSPRFAGHGVPCPVVDVRRFTVVPGTS